MNVDQMPAGRELDALVAEKVMGWTVGPVDDDYLDREGKETSWTTGLCHSTRKPFRPSTEIAAAWEVVEKLKLSLIPVTDGWIVSPHHLFEGLTGAGPTAPLAICRAAIKMHEISIP